MREEIIIFIFQLRGIAKFFHRAELQSQLLQHSEMLIIMRAFLVDSGTFRIVGCGALEHVHLREGVRQSDDLLACGQGESSELFLLPCTLDV